MYCDEVCVHFCIIGLIHLHIMCGMYGIPNNNVVQIADVAIATVTRTNIDVLKSYRKLYFMYLVKI